MMETKAQQAAFWYTAFTLLWAVFGACIGSFLNVCIYRIPRDIGLGNPSRSFCPACKHQIPWYLNIPLLSWFMLRGKCRFCGAAITARYVLVELLVAVLFALVWLKFDFRAGPRLLGLAPVTDWQLVAAYWLVIGGLVVATFVDFEHLIIPDRVSLGGIAAGLLFSAAAPALHGESTRSGGLFEAALGVLAGSGVLWGAAILGKLAFKKDAMGFGDVKLLGAIGAFLGLKAIFFTILVSSLLGSVVGITLVLTGRKEMQSRIPYGPYLALAAVLWILWGPVLWEGYLNLFRPSLAAM